MENEKRIRNQEIRFRELIAFCSKGDPNTTKNIKITLHRGILGKEPRIFLDIQDRLWYVPYTSNRYGDRAPHVDYPLQLHFDAQGDVTHGVVLHPYYDPNIPMTPEEEATSSYMGYPPANAGHNEPYEGCDT